MTVTSRILSQTRTSAANAVRHGLSGSFYVPEHARGHVAEIAEELKNVFCPFTPDDEQMLQEIAICRWQVFEVDRLLDLKSQNEFTRGPEFFERHLQAEFREHLELLSQNPTLGLEALSTTIKGCEYLLGIWNEARNILLVDAPIYPEILKKVAHAMGSPWPLHIMSPETLAKVAGFISLMGPLTDLSRLWSQDDLHQGLPTKLRLDFYLGSAGKTPDLRNSIIRWIDEKIREISAFKEILDTQLSDRIKVFSTCYAGYGMLDPIDSKHVNTLRRYQTKARNRAWKLENILRNRKCPNGKPLIRSYSAMNEIPFITPSADDNHTGTPHDFLQESDLSSVFESISTPMESDEQTVAPIIAPRLPAETDQIATNNPEPSPDEALVNLSQVIASNNITANLQNNIQGLSPRQIQRLQSKVHARREKQRKRIASMIFDLANNK